MCLQKSKYRGLLERLKKGGYSDYVIARIIAHLSANELEKDTGGGSPFQKSGAFSDTARAELFRDYIEEVLVRPVNEAHAEIAAIQIKTHLLIKTSKLAMFKERLQSKFEGFKRRAFGMLNTIEEGVRSHAGAQPVTEYVSVGGGETKMHKPWGKPEHYLSAEESAKAKGGGWNAEERWGFINDTAKRFREQSS